MALGTLYSFRDNTRTVSLLKLAEMNGVKLNLEETFAHQFSPELAEKFPLQKLPCFIAEDGFSLFEYIAILNYIASKGADLKGFFGKDAKEQAQVNEAINFANTELLKGQIIAPWIRMCRGAMPYNKRVFETTKAASLDILAYFDRHLADRTYLVGNRPTMADLTTATFLRVYYRFILTKDLRLQFTNVTRYYVTMYHQFKLEEHFPLELIDKVEIAKAN
ncbi:glutathione S-transferase [Schizosaccharomyces japonicus yFS275]|uniref:Glutathione S-transferase n=1 Tax=Schizosaccharomyces japonicus (strain yFS275 / FY16936) TaxID=402676 RepID=B6K594_SCHJY|nr:glutathione S-transferase [Schizosaccharomyces japonicus yFS275]EEB08698.2 glutathione S-transferase [Schizosaccharomyces japonicus yFS275]